MTDSRIPTAASLRTDRLRIYLQDHYAAASAGTALARRAADNQRPTALGDELAALAAEFADDQQALHELMIGVGIGPDRVKTVAALGAERLGRLKLNGNLLRRSPLSNVVEVEGMLLVAGSATACWRTLRQLADVDDRLDRDRLDALLARAEEHTRTLQSQHDRLVADTFLDGE